MMRSTPGVVAFAPEQHAAIDDDPFAVVRRAEAIGVEIHADLARPAERQEDQFVVTRELGHQAFCFRRVAGVDQDQAADGEVGIEMVDGRGLRVEQIGEAAGAITVIGLPYSSLMRVDRPSISPT